MNNESKKESTSVTATKQATKQPDVKTVKENKMYIGPTIAGVVRHSTVFKDGKYPEKVEACIKKFPMMELLFVGMKELPKATKEIRVHGSALQEISARVLEKFKEV